jgi:hypothetical protein
VAPAGRSEALSLAKILIFMSGAKIARSTYHAFNSHAAVLRNFCGDRVSSPEERYRTGGGVPIETERNAPAIPGLNGRLKEVHKEKIMEARI